MAKKDTEKDNIPRDEEGNMIFPKFNLDWWAFRSWEVTYIFQEWNEKMQMFLPIINLHSEEEMLQKKDKIEQDGIIIYELFPFPEKPVTEDFIKSNWQKYCSYFYFKEIFDFKYFKGTPLTDYDIRTLILRKSLFIEIESMINKFSIQKVHDIILYLIAKIQDMYVEDIEYYERPEMVKQMNNIGKEVDKLINVIDRIAPDEFYKKFDERQPQLKYLSFIFPDIEPIKLQDPLLVREIIEAVKQEFGKGAYRNWKKDLKRYATFRNRNNEIQSFRFDLAISLHNFFQDQNLFPKSDEIIASGDELLCIANILEFGLLKIGKEGISDEEKKKNIRNYLNPERHKLETYPTYTVIEPEIVEKLDTYFDKDFLRCVPMEKSMEIGVQAFGITERFEMPHLLKEIIHLIDCIRHREFQIGWQFSTLDQSSRDYPILSDFHTLVSSVTNDKERKKIIEISFNLDGNENSVSLNSRLPLLLIERALAEYYQNHIEEFDCDIVQSKIEDIVEQRAFKVTPLGKYQEQQNRFLPQLCSQFYKFLLNEAPPKDNEYNISEKYSLIIALVLEKSHIFKKLKNDENIIQAKVKQWLQDAKMVS